jgi:biotin operon repressor
MDTMVKISLAERMMQYLEENHRGEANLITGNRLARILGTSEVQIRFAVNHLRSTGDIRIGSTAKVKNMTGGYYWIMTREECLKTIAQLRGRISGIYNAARGLERFMEKTWPTKHHPIQMDFL